MARDGESETMSFPAWGRLLLRGLALAFLLVVPAWAQEDRIVLKDGKVIEGTILKRDGAEIQIVVGGLVQTHYMANIAEVVEGDATTIGPGEPAAQEALQHYQAQRFLEAWQKYAEMEATEPGAAKRHEDQVRATYDRVAQLGATAIANKDLAAVEALARALEGETPRAMVGAVYPDRMESFDKALRLLNGTTHYLRGAKARTATPPQPDVAKLELEQATTVLQPGDRYHLLATHQLAMTSFARAQGMYDTLNANSTAEQIQEVLAVYGEATSKWNAIVSDFRANRFDAADRSEVMALASEVQATYLPGVSGRAQTLRAQLEKLQAIANATPTPRPTPSPTPTPTPTPSPTPTFGEAPGEWMSATFNSVLPESMKGADMGQWGIYAAVFVAVFWFVPWVIFKILRKRIDPIADQWAARVFFLGPITLLGYIVSFVMARPQRVKIKKSKHPCPHCGFGLDEINAYEKLDFAHCPNCGGEIEPIHSLDEYITFLGNSVATDAEKVTLGIVSMAGFVGQEVMQRLVRSVLTHAIRSRASDVHIEPQQQLVSIRHRIDGVMAEMTRLPASLGPAIVSAIKVNANMDISEKRKPQDGAWQVTVDDADIDLRVASSPSGIGETVTIRILDFRSIQLETKNLGMPKTTRDIFEKAIREPHGLILVTGPTGSGKTTTLYVALRSLATGDKNIISIEDPIEFRIPGINQIQVNPVAGLTFASGLRSMLRQDPDIIMVGEIRDKETAEIAINAAQTGHLVFSTLHTIDAASTVTRLYDLGISPRMFSDALSLVVAQRLIRLVCPECKKTDRPDASVLREIGIREGEEGGYPFMIGKGCRFCNNMGYYGRSGIFEMLAPNAQIRSALEQGTHSTTELRELAISNGMRTLREEALVLLKQGLTTAEEVLRVTK